jgi:hypothetical protein
VLFHDESIAAERRGFWTFGQRRVQVTIACPEGCVDGVTLRVHSGNRPNHLQLSTHGWRHEVDLSGETPVAVPIPPPTAGGSIELDITTTTGFVPFEVDPSNADRRYLGVWIEMDVTREER